MKRGRNQRRRPGGGSNPNRALDSNGPDVRIRGTANQIYDKYQALARDASSAGDRIKAESYLQHAEHYYRLIRAALPTPAQNQQPSANGEEGQPAVDGDNPGQSDNQRAPQQRENRRPPRNNDRQNGAADDASPGEQSQPASSAPEPVAEDSSEPEAPAKAARSKSDPDSVEEKKPRRRRAPRKSVKRAEDSGADDKQPEKVAAD